MYVDLTNMEIEAARTALALYRTELRAEGFDRSAEYAQVDSALKKMEQNR